ncbi:MAG: hypothetical protein ACD_21C00147G0003 [uncultured bacterium]|nr:MAG: hypothetical protein ACD_21C00147G0003 [uncultured bacterium]
MYSKKAIKVAMSVGISVLSFYVTYAVAAAASTDLGAVADNVIGVLDNVVKLLTAGSYMAGFGLTVASLFKFKQHKDNPQQVQLGTCITMLLVGVALIFLPSVLSTGGATIFGAAAKKGAIGGVDKF